QAPPSPSGTQVVGTRAVGAVRTGILRIADTLVDMGNVAVDGGFIETPDGWRCRMRDPIDFGVLKTMFQFPPNVLFESDDTILDAAAGYAIEGPGAPSDTTA